MSSRSCVVLDGSQRGFADTRRPFCGARDVPQPLSSPEHSPDGSDARGAVGASAGDDRDQLPAHDPSRRAHELPPPPPLPHGVRPVTVQADTAQPGAWRAWWHFAGRRLSSAFTISLLFHCFMLLVMAVIVHASLPGSSFLGLTAYANVAVPLPDEGLDSLPVRL